MYLPRVLIVSMMGVKEGLANGQSYIRSDPLNYRPEVLTQDD